jgi:hypothetical protein
MQPITAGPFTNSDVRLRIWVASDTNAFQLLAPDQRLGSVGFAMTSATVPDGSLTAGKLANGAVQTANLANGAVTSLQLSPNAVSSLYLANGAVTSLKLAAGSVQSAALAPASVSLSNLNFTLGYVNVQNQPYLAKADGVTDDTAAICPYRGRQQGWRHRLPPARQLLYRHPLDRPRQHDPRRHLAHTHCLFAKQRHHPPRR